MSDENTNQPAEQVESVNRADQKKTSGCLPIIVVCFIIFGLLSMLGGSDEYETFVENTKSTSETPWEYLPNKDVGYCVNINISKSLDESVLETYCSQDRSVIETFSQCFHHETGPLGGHVQELMKLTQFMMATSMGRMSDYEAGDRARVLLCSRKSGHVIKMNKDYIENDIQKIKTEREEAKEYGVSFECLKAYQTGNKLDRCSEKEMNKLERLMDSINEDIKIKTVNIDGEIIEYDEEIHKGNEQEIRKAAQWCKENNLNGSSDLKQCVGAKLGWF